MALTVASVVLSLSNRARCLSGVIRMLISTGLLAWFCMLGLKEEAASDDGYHCKTSEADIFADALLRTEMRSEKTLQSNVRGNGCSTMKIESCILAINFIIIIMYP